MALEVSGSDFNEIISAIDGLPERENARQIILKTPKGCIQFREEMLQSDLYVLEAHYKMQDDVLLFGKGENDLLELQFNLSDRDIFYKGKSNTEQAAPARSGNITFLSAEENMANIFWRKNIHYHTFDIHLPLSMLDHYAGKSKMMDEFLSKIHRKESGKLSANTISIHPAIYNTIQDIRNCTYEGLTRHIYLESKAYELIALLYEHAQGNRETMCLSPDDQERIRFAASVIRDHLDSPLTIPQLARLAGINRTKLKNGFKMVFGTTVFGYLQDIRMHQAKRYLLDTSLSIQEISILLGYQSTSNFSAAFKKTLGFSPMKLREKQLIS